MVYGLGDLGNSLGNVAGVLLRGDDVVLDNFTDDNLVGLFGLIDGMGATPAAKDKARKKVLKQLKQKAVLTLLAKQLTFLKKHFLSSV